MQSNANFGNISEPKCATNGVKAEEAGAAFNAGDASSVVLVTGPFIHLANLRNGALLMQASVSFRTEPYN